MNKIDKHSFEPVSLLTVENGLLDITIIPAMNQPDWVVPSELIISIEEYHERIWTYLWQNQEVVIYPLVTYDVAPNKIIVLEGNTDVHRVGLQINGELQYKQVRISDVKDTTLPESYLSQANQESKNDVENNMALVDKTKEHVVQQESEQKNNAHTPVRLGHQYSSQKIEYMYQAIMIDGETYLVPDLDELSHQLVDLDS